jgi:hypothetical protein
VKNSLFSNILLEKAIKIFLIILMFFNSYIINSFISNSFGIDQNTYTYINDQALNSLLESSSEKVNLKIIHPSFKNYFYSYDYYTKKLAQLPKILAIVSETYSEQNIRLSSYLFTQSSTST